MPSFSCRIERPVTLAAGVALEVDVDIAGARDWCIILKNTGGVNAVTAVTVERSPLGGIFGPATALPAGVPLAAGASLEFRGQNEPLTTLRLTITSTSGTTVQIEGGGW